jgi:hypothetical protein
MLTYATDGRQADPQTFKKKSKRMKARLKMKVLSLLAVLVQEYKY